jgi:hypothetical protein
MNQYQNQNPNLPNVEGVPLSRGKELAVRTATLVLALGGLACGGVAVVKGGPGFVDLAQSIGSAAEAANAHLGYDEEEAPRADEYWLEAVDHLEDFRDEQKDAVPFLAASAGLMRISTRINSWADKKKKSDLK